MNTGKGCAELGIV